MDQDGLQRLPPNPLAFDTRNFADLVGLRLHLKALYAACDTDGTCVKPLYAEKVSIILDVTHSSPFDVVTMGLCSLHYILIAFVMDIYHHLLNSPYHRRH